MGCPPATTYNYYYIYSIYFNSARDTPCRPRPPPRHPQKKYNRYRHRHTTFTPPPQPLHPQPPTPHVSDTSRITRSFVRTRKSDPVKRVTSNVHASVRVADCGIFRAEPRPYDSSGIDDRSDNDSNPALRSRTASL